MALEKGLPSEAIRRSEDGAGTTLEMAHEPGPDRLIVARQVQFGDRLAVVPGFRPHDLVWPRDWNTHNRRGLTFAGHPPQGWRGDGGLGGQCGRLRFHLRRRLVFAQTLERGLSNLAAGGPSGELYLGDQLRLHPMDV